MPFENISQLVSTADKEVQDVGVAEEALAASRKQLEEAQSVVATKQAGVDAARESVSTERTEAIAALRSIVEAVQAEISKLEPSA